MGARDPTVLGLALGAAVASLLLHMPVVQRTPLYSDVVSVYQRVFWLGEGWYGEPSRYGLPYVHYFLEYPPLVGLLWAASALPRLWLGEPEALLAHYLVQGAVLAASTAAVVVEASRLSRRLGSPVDGAVVAALPSTIVYGVYNWDALAMALALRGLNAYLDGRVALAGALLGLGAAAKLYPALALLALLVEDPRRAPSPSPPFSLSVSSAGSSASRFASGSPIPMTTTLVMRSSAARRRSSRSTCSRISPVDRLRFTPLSPLAQKTHPIAQPTCVLTQTVRRCVSRMSTHSTCSPSASSLSSFSVRSEAT